VPLAEVFGCGYRDDGSVPVNQWAYVWFEAADARSDFDPDALTSRLGVTPTSSHRKGEVRVPGKVWKRTSWRYGGSPSGELDWDDLVGPVLTAFDGQDGTVRDAVRDMQLAAGLMIVSEMTAEKSYAGRDDRDAWGVPTPASGLSAENIARLARLGLSLDADMYVFLTEALENTE
jgi:hypothetical protein